MLDGHAMRARCAGRYRVHSGVLELLHLGNKQSSAMQWQ
jgi:hypothetical protein